MKVADAIAHEIWFLFPLSLYHQQVMELEAILVASQANLAAHEVQDVPEVVDLVDQRELEDHRRKYKLAERDNSYYFFLRSQVWSAVADVLNLLSGRQPLSTRADQLRHWRNWIGLQDKPSRQYVLNGISRGAPRHMPGKIPCKCRWIPVKDQWFPSAQWLAFVEGVLDICSHIFRLTAHHRAHHGGQRKVLKLQPFAPNLCFWLISTTDPEPEMSTCTDDDRERGSLEISSSIMHLPSKVVFHFVSLLGCVSAVVFDQISIKIKANASTSIRAQIANGFCCFHSSCAFSLCYSCIVQRIYATSVIVFNLILCVSSSIFRYLNHVCWSHSVIDLVSTWHRHQRNSSLPQSGFLLRWCRSSMLLLPRAWVYRLPGSYLCKCAQNMSKWSPIGQMSVLSSMFSVSSTIILNFWLLIFHFSFIQFTIRFEPPKIWILIWLLHAGSQVLCLSLSSISFSPFPLLTCCEFFSSIQGEAFHLVVLNSSQSSFAQILSSFHKAFPIFGYFPSSLSAGPFQHQIVPIRMNNSSSSSFPPLLIFGIQNSCGTYRPLFSPFKNRMGQNVSHHFVRHFVPLHVVYLLFVTLEIFEAPKFNVSPPPSANLFLAFLIWLAPNHPKLSSVWAHLLELMKSNFLLFHLVPTPACTWVKYARLDHLSVPFVFP